MTGYFLLPGVGFGAGFAPAGALGCDPRVVVSGRVAAAPRFVESIVVFSSGISVNFLGSRETFPLTPGQEHRQALTGRPTPVANP
jgi:hypothetical protein